MPTNTLSMPTSADISTLLSALDNVSSRDRFRLMQQQRRLQSTLAKRAQQSQAADTLEDTTLAQQYSKLAADIERSRTWVERRKAALPVVTFPDELPISEKREQITELIREHQVIVLAGETGSGKTTQLPKICLQLGRGVRGLIGHTQPRRIAARTVATRIAEELQTPLGESVGYQVRFTDKATDDTHIKLMTDGILLAEIQQDRFLSRYDTLIIDEAHERSLNIDFLMGYLKQLLPKRPDLKVIITSATIDVEKFSKHFNQAPVIEVSGRTYPVDVLYRPLLDNDDNPDIFSGIIAALEEIQTLGPSGDVLVFLSGERDIREAAVQLRRAHIPHLDILPLYARLTVAEQNKIFQSHRGRRVVLSTNVAETALTVPGIRYVIDTGTARISRYSFRTKVQRLPIEPISQASANQRKGRCGRVSAGTCIRLYSEDDFNQRPEFTDAEILRTNLAAVILQMVQLKLGDVRHFSFVDMPDERLINDGYKLLEELQAIKPGGELTHLGRRLALLPVDPRLGRMLLAAETQKCFSEVAIIISALSVQDPRERPANKQQAADQSHRQWWHDDSDFMGYLTLWQEYEQQRQALSSNQLQKWCKKQYLAFMRLREWRDIHTQICVAAKRINITHNTEPAGYQRVHYSLLSGLLGNIGCLAEQKNITGKGGVGEYLGTRNRRFSLFPSSSQFKKKPKWVVASQLLETSKLYAHNIAKVDPQWILDNAKHLLKRHYSEPHYQAKSGQTMAFEKVTLYGVVLVEKQRVAYSHIDAAMCRELFIRSALVEGQYADHGRIKQQLAKQSDQQHFFKHQQALLHELHELEAKSRRRDIVADEQVLFEFYDARIPADIVNLKGFEHWRKQQEQETPRLLYVEREDLMQHGASDVTEAQFPDHLVIEGMTLAVNYYFEPNHSDDGVSLQVPVSVLHLIPEQRLQWLVPGLLREKCIAMVKALPKQWRKHFVPVPSYIDKALAHLAIGNYSLSDALAEQLHRQTGTTIPPELWQDIQLDPYYQMNICIIDEHQQRLDSGRDLSQLRERYRDHVQQHLEVVGDSFERDNITAWDFGDLPETYELQQQGVTMRAYPGLVDEHNSVALKLFDNPDDAVMASMRGVVRLIALDQHQTVKYCRRHLLSAGKVKNQTLSLSVVDMGGQEQILDDIIMAAIRQVCCEGITTAQSLPRTPVAFTALVEQGRADVVARAEAITTALLASLEHVVAVKKAMKQSKNPLVIAHASSDIKQQLAGLFYIQAIYDIPFEWLKQYPRYTKAMLLRLEKVPANMHKDRAMIEEIDVATQRLQAKREQQGESAYWLNEPLQHYRWMLEELRISLFAQTLKTVMPVSTKRLNKQWQLC